MSYSVDIIFVIAEILILIAYSFRKMLPLRLMAVAASSGYILGALLAGLALPGMKVIVFFSSLTALVNLIQIYRLVIERVPFLIPEEYKHLYSTMFSTITTKQFSTIIDLAIIKEYEENEVIINDNEAVKELILIKTGEAYVFKNGIKVATLVEYFFIGEMSFLTHQNARGTVVAGPKLTCLVWSQERIDQLQQTNPEIHSAFKQAVMKNLIEKIETNDQRFMPAR